jgi:short-subunit dehydrogenase
MNSFIMITGACGVLGKLFTHECARRGYHLYLIDLNEEGSTFASKIAKDYQIETRYLTCDLTSQVNRDQLFKSISMDSGKFWGLINVAGIEHEGSFIEKSREQILSIIRVNIEGTLDLTNMILNLRDHSRRFMLINVSSLAAFFPMPYKAAYAASKGFLLDFSRALREEIRDFGSVTTLCPAGLPTTQERIQRIQRQGWWGKITTCDPKEVVYQTLNYALKGKAVYIPGVVNQILPRLASVLPAWLTVKVIAKRWH